MLGAGVDAGEPGVDALVVVAVLAGVQVAEAGEGLEADTADSFGVGW